MEHCGVPVETQTTSPVIKMSYESFEYKSRKRHCRWMSPCRPVRLQGFDILLCLQLKCACVDLGVEKVTEGGHTLVSGRKQAFPTAQACGFCLGSSSVVLASIMNHTPVIGAVPPTSQATVQKTPEKQPECVCGHPQTKSSWPRLLSGGQEGAGSREAQCAGTGRKEAWRTRRLWTREERRWREAKVRK